AELLRKSQKLTSGEVVVATDLHHALLLVALGMTVVLPGCDQDATPATVKRLIDSVDGSGATIALGPVSSWRAVADKLAREGRMLPGLRAVLLVGGPASVATHEALGRILPAGESRDLYGMTEAAAVASIAGGDVLGDTRALTD